MKEMYGVYCAVGRTEEDNERALLTLAACGSRKCPGEGEYDAGVCLEIIKT